MRCLKSSQPQVAYILFYTEERVTVGGVCRNEKICEARSTSGARNPLAYCGRIRSGRSWHEEHDIWAGAFSEHRQVVVTNFPVATDSSMAALGDR